MADSMQPSEAHAAAAAAMRRLRDRASTLFVALAQDQPVAPHHMLALRVIAGGATTPGEVAEAIDRHPSSVSRLLDQLVADELVQRDPHPEDRRQVLLALSPDGARLVEQFDRLDGALLVHLLAGFDEGDADKFAGYLDRFADAAAHLADRLDDDPELFDDFR